MGASVAARKKRKYQQSEWGFVEPGKTTTSVDVARTWVRESGGSIQQLVVKEITDEVPEEWVQAGAEAGSGS
jgi:hypothetical protein